jgi:SPP1 gp7 family putative phage head morphogenesis protein
VADPRPESDKQRRQLRRQERHLAQTLLDRFTAAWRVIKGELPEPRTPLENRRAADRVAQTVNGEIRGYTAAAAAAIQAEVIVTGHNGTADAHTLITTSMGPPPRGVPPVRAAAIGTVQPDLGIVLQLLDELGPEAAFRTRELLIGGLRQGWHPSRVAREVRAALGITYSRSLTIARTEMLRAYRNAALEQYRESPVVHGWVWLATLDATTCPVCIAMHGTEHDLNETLDTHPNCCRCAMVPQTVSWKDLGYRGVRETNWTPSSGSEWFARQPEPLQLAVLGRSKYTAYRNGEIGLEDLVARTRSARFGRGRRQRSLAEALEKRRAA